MVLFLHGLNRCGACWNPIRAAAAWDGALTPDHPGHGVGPRLGRYRVVDYLPSVRHQVRENRGAILFGHSLGAMLALAAAAEEPDHVRGIILEDPPFHTMGRRLPGTELHTYFEALLPHAGHGLPQGEAARRLGESEFGLPGKRRRIGEVRDASALRLMAAFLDRVDRRAIEAVMDGRWLEGYDEGDAIRRVRCPVLVLQSDPSAGGMLTDEDARAMAGSGSDVTLVRLAGVGHQAHWQDPVRVAYHALAFVTALGR
jgi:pimeloyl-ACP methyl ester carboxylesterase